MTAVERALAGGAIAPSAAAAARARRRALRRWVERTSGKPDASVIGCAEHRELVEEILDRAGPDGAGRSGPA